MSETTQGDVQSLAAEVQLLRAELRRLLDRQAIRDCVVRYARGLDRHDEEILASVFHEDAIDHHGDFIGGREEFVPWANALHEEGWTAHTHFMVNHRADIDGDVAHSETYVLFVLRRKDGRKIDLGGGRYIDRLERRNGEWRIAARELVIDWRAEADPSDYGRAHTYPHGTWDRSDPSYRPLELRLPTGSR
jgi:ketosteroid isomerase-like protein